MQYEYFECEEWRMEFTEEEKLEKEPPKISKSATDTIEDALFPFFLAVFMCVVALVGWLCIGVVWLWKHLSAFFATVLILMFFFLVTPTLAGASNSVVDTPGQEIVASTSSNSEQDQLDLWASIQAILVLVYIMLGIGFFFGGYNRWDTTGKIMYFTIFPIHCIVLVIAQRETKKEQIPPADKEKYVVRMAANTGLVLLLTSIFLLCGGCGILIFLQQGQQQQEQNK